MSKNLVITTKSWKPLIESLHANSKHGYNSLESLKHDGVYFTAVLCQDTDCAYTERLKIVTGEEEDGIKGLIDFLANKLTLNISAQPLTEVVVKGIKEAMVEYATSETATTIKIKRTPRGKK